MSATFLLAQLSRVHPSSPGGTNGFHPPLCVGVRAPDTLLGGLRSKKPSPAPAPAGEDGPDPTPGPVMGGDGRPGKRCNCRLLDALRTSSDWKSPLGARNDRCDPLDRVLVERDNPPAAAEYSASMPGTGEAAPRELRGVGGMMAVVNFADAAGVGVLSSICVRAGGATALARLAALRASTSGSCGWATVASESSDRLRSSDTGAGGAVGEGDMAIAPVLSFSPSFRPYFLPSATCDSLIGTVVDRAGGTGRDRPAGEGVGCGNAGTRPIEHRTAELQLYEYTDPGAARGKQQVTRRGCASVRRGTKSGNASLPDRQTAARHEEVGWVGGWIGSVTIVQL